MHTNVQYNIIQADLYRQLQQLNSVCEEEISDEDEDDEALLEDEVEGDMDEEPA